MEVDLPLTKRDRTKHTVVLMTITRMQLLRSVSTFHVFDSVDDEELVSPEDELSSWRSAIAAESTSDSAFGTWSFQSDPESSFLLFQKF